MTQENTSEMLPEYTLRQDGSSAIVLFDGVCSLCNGWVNFVIDRDVESRFRFAALQSDAGRSLIEQRGKPARFTSDSMIVIDGDETLEKSDAILRIAASLGSGWPVARVLRFVPRVIRDGVYDLVARNRYSWFGSTESCRVPTEELKGRFIEFHHLS